MNTRWFTHITAWVLALGLGAAVLEETTAALIHASERTPGTVIRWWYPYFGGAASVRDSLTNIVAIDGGYQHLLALRADGTVAVDDSWNIPPAGVNHVVAIAGGNQFSLALKDDGTVVAWGVNDSGQTNVPAGLTNVVSIAAGYRHCMALKDDGTVTAWGWNVYGQTNVPEGLSHIRAIDAGTYHSLALTESSTVVAWGYNNVGQTNVPPGLSNVTAIAAGGAHNLALRTDGTVVAWGYNDKGQSDVPVGLSNVVAIAAKGWRSLVLTADQNIEAWYQGISGTGPEWFTNIVAIASTRDFNYALVVGQLPVGEPRLDVEPSPSGINIQITGFPRFWHDIEYCEDLREPVQWQVAKGWFSLTNSPVVWFDPATNAPARLYRVGFQPLVPP
ncbi:MAG: hypothetical protein M1608_13965 [Candidatus Omnitrophica bacterium]|nr:hypothetical protein [Candidatus Omnitrophota bacterium]